MSAQDPFDYFGEIFAQAQALAIENANAMHLATVDGAGQPSVRVVLLKDFDRRGFVFYTNLESRKGRDLAANPKAELNFYWRELARQIRVTGAVEPVSAEDADAYFASRPRLSQLGAWASRQSAEMPSTARLIAEVARQESRYLGRDVPRPAFWSGFRLVPERFEFWRAKPFRLHQRLLYRRTADGWEQRLIYP